MIQVSHQMETVDVKRVSQPAPLTPPSTTCVERGQQRAAALRQAVDEQVRRKSRPRTTCWRAAVNRPGRAAAIAVGNLGRCGDRDTAAMPMPTTAIADREAPSAAIRSPVSRVPLRARVCRWRSPTHRRQPVLERAESLREDRSTAWGRRSIRPARCRRPAPISGTVIDARRFVDVLAARATRDSP